MSARILIVKLPKWPVEIVAIPPGVETHTVVEKMQRTMQKDRGLAHAPGCKWKIAEGATIVSAMIESLRLGWDRED